MSYTAAVIPSLMAQLTPCQASGRTFQHPPDWVRAAGMMAFDGDEGALNQTMRKTRRPTMFQKYRGLSVCLLQPPADNSLIKLKSEPASGYDLQGPAIRNAAPHATVIDIGANIGYVAISVAKMRPDLHIVAVEPGPLTFFYLLWNCWLNGVRTHAIATTSSKAIEPGVEAVHAAIGREGETVTLHFNPNRTQDTIMNSMYRRNSNTLGCGSVFSRMTGKRCLHKMGNRTTDIRAVTVPALDVLALLQRKGNRAGTVALIKIDCEGCEVPFLKEERVRRWFTDATRVKHVTGEVHFAKYPGFEPGDVEQTRLAYTSRGCKWYGQIHVHC